MALQLIGRGTRARSSQVNQIIRLLNGDADFGHPVNLTAVDAPGDWALDIRNQDTTDGQHLRIRSSDGTRDLLLVTDDGVSFSSADPETGASFELASTLSATAGFWTATNGSALLTRLEASDSGDLRRWIGVRIDTQTFQTRGVVNSGGVTTVTLDANYVGAGGSVEVFKAPDDLFDLTDGAGNTLMSVRGNGDILFGANVGLPAEHLEWNSDDGINAVDFWYDAVHRRLHLRTAVFLEVGDPVDIAIRHGGDGPYPDGPLVQSLDTQNLGAIYWQGCTETGDFKYRQTMIYTRAAGNISNTNGGGRLIFQTSRMNAGTALDARRDRVEITADGYLSLYRPNEPNNSLGPFRSLDIDSGGNLNVGRDDGLTNVQFFRTLALYANAGAGTAAATLSTDGLMLPVAPGVPGANTMTRESGAKAWCCVSESGGTYTLQSSYNITSISKAGVGDITVTLNRDMVGAYVAVVSCNAGNARLAATASQAAGSIRVLIYIATSGANIDSGFNLVIFGNQ